MKNFFSIISNPTWFLTKRCIILLLDVLISFIWIKLMNELINELQVTMKFSSMFIEIAIEYKKILIIYENFIRNAGFHLLFFQILSEMQVFIYFSSKFFINSLASKSLPRAPINAFFMIFQIWPIYWNCKFWPKIIENAKFSLKIIKKSKNS